MKRILYLYGGQLWHETEWAGQPLAALLAANGSYQLELTSDLDVFTL